ncbi:hypothetical protein M885DRAFT_612931 [Pelagophyceae sp. CCMP2097]|nr:hypothetical protein M885DRAFT_612931 [Pelagophyceae sp. CCMP2097]
MARQRAQSLRGTGKVASSDSADSSHSQDPALARAPGKKAWFSATWATLLRRRPAAVDDYRDSSGLVNELARFSPGYVHLGLAKDEADRPTGRNAVQKWREPCVDKVLGCILFVDISGFTRLSTRLGIEALQRHMNRIYTRAVEIIVSHDGDVLKYAGDAMLVLWVAQDRAGLAECVERAARCALALQHAPGAQHRVVEESVDVTLNMHCAIGCGDTCVYRVGDAHRWEFVVAGAPLEQIRLAEPFAGPSETSLSREATELIHEAAALRAAAPRPAGSLPPLRTGPPKKSGSNGVTLLVPPTKLQSLRSAASSTRTLVIAGPAGGAPKGTGALTMGQVLYLQRRGRTSIKLRDDKSADVLRGFALPPVLGAIESLVGEGALGAARRTSTGVLESHLAEQRTCTTCFTNLVGTEFSAALRQGDLATVQECFGTVQLAAAKRGGLVRQFIVDDKGCVAITCFGVRGSSFEDNERRAVLYAHALVRALAKQNIAAYCGITVGVTFCGLVGAPFRCEYAVMGPSVNLAARLMAAASKQPNLGDCILVDERVRDAVDRDGAGPTRARASTFEFADGGTLHFEARAPISAKGFAEPVRVFATKQEEVAGSPAGAPDRASPAAETRWSSHVRLEVDDAEDEADHSRCFGRDSALADIYEKIADATDRCFFIFVDGDAGLGKTALLRQLGFSHSATHTVVDANADSKADDLWRTLVTSLTELNREAGAGFRAGTENAEPAPEAKGGGKLAMSASASSGFGGAMVINSTRLREQSFTLARGFVRHGAELVDDALSMWETPPVRAPENEVLATTFKALVCQAATDVVLLVDDAQDLSVEGWDLFRSLATSLNARVAGPRLAVILASRPTPAATRTKAENDLRLPEGPPALAVTLQVLNADAACSLICARLKVRRDNVQIDRVRDALDACGGHPMRLRALADGLALQVRKAAALAESAALANGGKFVEKRCRPLDMSEAVEAIVAKALLACAGRQSGRLPERCAVDAIISSMRRVDCTAGTALMTQGEKANLLYVVVSGSLECSVDGVEVNVSRTGDVVGEAAIIGGAVARRAATVVALDDAVLWAVTVADSQAWLRFTRFAGAGEAQREHELIEALGDLSGAGRDAIAMRVGLPSSMAGNVTHRLDALSLQATALAKLASCFGAVFHDRAVKHCYRGVLRLRVDEALGELVDAGLLKRDPSDAALHDCGSLYRFATTTANEVIYGTILVEQKRESHLAIGEFFEECHSRKRDLDREELLSRVEDRESESPSGSVRSLGSQSPPPQSREKSPVPNAREVSAVDAVLKCWQLTAVDLRSRAAVHFARAHPLSAGVKVVDFCTLAAADQMMLGSYREAERLYRLAVAAVTPRLAGAAAAEPPPPPPRIALSLLCGLSELYSRYDMAPLPRAAGECAPLGGGSNTILHHVLRGYEIDVQALSPRKPRLRADLDRADVLLVATSLRNLGWYHIKFGLESKFTIQLAEACFATAVGYLTQLGDVPLTLAETLNGQGTFLSECALELARQAKAGATVPLGKRTAGPGDMRKVQRSSMKTMGSVVDTEAAPALYSGPSSRPDAERSEDDFWDLADETLTAAYRIAARFAPEGLELAQASMSLGSLAFERAAFEASRAFYTQAMDLYTLRLGAEHPRTAHAYTGLARVMRMEGSRLLADRAPPSGPAAQSRRRAVSQSRGQASAREAGVIMLRQAAKLVARAVVARKSLGPGHVKYQESVNELAKLELQISTLETAAAD